MRNVVMQASYVDAVVFPDQHYASGLSDISSVEIAGLESQSPRPHSSPDTKLTD